MKQALRIRSILICNAIILFLFMCITSHAADVKYSYDSLNRLTRADYSNGIRVNYTYDAAGNRLAKETLQSADSDTDGSYDNWDICLATANGPTRGTCVKTVGGVIIGTGITCTPGGSECGAGQTCQLEQGDMNNNGIGDACECYADIDGSTSGKVDAFDLLRMKQQFNRTGCTPETCQADLNGDGKVDSFDLLIMKVQFNKTGCPVE